MKTKFTQAKKNFQPIEVTITLETPEDLKNFLLMTSAIGQIVMGQIEAYSDEMPTVSIDDDTDEEVDATDLSNFIDNLVTGMQWHELRNIYNSYKGK